MSISEVRMQPLTDSQQVCRHFELNVTPRAQVTAHTDHLGNMVHHFDIPGQHTQLVIGPLRERLPFSPDRGPGPLGCGCDARLVEAWLPRLGWVGFDPTDNLAAERHIRVAIGRDYGDIPPTRGVFKGGAPSELSVAVQVSPAEAPESEMKQVTVSTWTSAPEAGSSAQSRLEAFRQQQQQQ